MNRRNTVLIFNNTEVYDDVYNAISIWFFFAFVATAAADAAAATTDDVDTVFISDIL